MNCNHAQILDLWSNPWGPGLTSLRARESGWINPRCLTEFSTNALMMPKWCHIMPQATNKMSVPVKYHNFIECKLNVTITTCEISESKPGESSSKQPFLNHRVLATLYRAEQYDYIVCHLDDTVFFHTARMQAGRQRDGSTENGGE